MYLTYCSTCSVQSAISAISAHLSNYPNAILALPPTHVAPHDPHPLHAGLTAAGDGIIFYESGNKKRTDRALLLLPPQSSSLHSIKKMNLKRTRRPGLPVALLGLLCGLKSRHGNRHGLPSAVASERPR